MMAQRRLEPTQAAIRYMCERFALGGHCDGRLTPIARGAMGRIWRLSLSGRDYAVKELFWGFDEAAVVREAALRDAAADAGVASPANLRTVGGRYVCTLPTDLGGADVRVFTWVEGRQVEAGEPGVIRWVGHTLGVLHGLRYSYPHVPSDPWYDRVPTPEQWDDLLTRGRVDRRPWASLLEQRLPLLNTLCAQVKPLDPAALIYSHLDFQPQNVFVDRAGRHVLLDWEDAGPSMPDRVLAGVLTPWCTEDGVVYADRVREFLHAYRLAGGTGRMTGMESFSANLAGYLNYVSAQASFSLDHTQAADMREYADHEASGALANPSTTELFGEILRAVEGVRRHGTCESGRVDRGDSV
ncbi:Ser/Thr protein kinase RdoA (MazF antagonist) [Actinopolymorpha cephalotaxi]|uniref:Ser/Thr protein kinase RdoA (MazF antagonist) n=1 Tax=Actinopolymorpha cephalotaxi TaxID=504797 RepID=A0ABX2S8M7_9ACTN|nr:Ser/Thr protein kinase RdoA (MazF antagonist) [Actinopolymorpha cephalotaxi]